jgi:hypothetical protein
MFYEEKQIDLILTCPYCRNRYKEPKVLPCGVSICNRCVNSTVQNTSQTDSFSCCFCSKSHAIPTEGFVDCFALQELLNKRPKEVYRSHEVSELTEHLNELEFETVDIGNSICKGVYYIKQHCLMLRNRIQMRAERLADEIYNMNKQMQAEVDKYERECVEAFNSSDEQTQELKKKLESKKQFCDQVKCYLAKPDINDLRVKNLLDLTNEHLLEMESVRAKSNFVLFKQSRSLSFIDRSNKFDKSAFGYLSNQSNHDSNESQNQNETIIQNKNDSPTKIENRLFQCKVIEEARLDERLLELNELINKSSWNFVRQEDQNNSNFQEFHSTSESYAKKLLMIRFPNNQFSFCGCSYQIKQGQGSQDCFQISFSLFYVLFLIDN